MKDDNSENISIDLTKYKPIKKSEIYSNIEQNTEDESKITQEGWIASEKKEYTFEKQAKVSVYDVAEYILEKIGEMSTMKLHKLLYYCQAWSLVWDEKKLFDEELEAWANGPVVRELFAYHKGHFTIQKIPIGNPDILNKEQKETIDAVIGYYGNKSAQWLIELTHLEEPWKKARKGLDQLERGDKIISLESMADYYSAL